MTFYRPSEETLNRVELARLQRRKLAANMSAVLATNEFYRTKFAGVSFDPMHDPLDRLPLTTRAELQADQLRHPLFGTNLTFSIDRYNRYHQTSGTAGVPMRWLDTPESWDWFKSCWCIVYRAAGLNERDRVAFPFSFGPFIGFWGAFEASTALGNLSLPAGGMTTTARLQYLIHNEVTVVCCTPTYAQRMCEVAAQERIDLASSPVRLLIVAGEPGGSIPPVRARIEAGFGARVIDHVGMTEMGAFGVECVDNPGGMHLIESEFMAEVIDPVTTTPVSLGQVGELVLTNLGRTASPLIRYRTGDLVSLSEGQCACGRWFSRMIGGILGRADDMITIRGNNVFPTAIEAIIREFSEVVEFRVSLKNRSGMEELDIEVECAASVASTPEQPALLDRIGAALRDRLHFRPNIRSVLPGTLPRFEMKAHRLIRPGV